MKITRRQFLKGTAAAGVVVSVGGFDVFLPKRAYPFSQSPIITKFKHGLPGLTPAGANDIGQYIPLATKHTIPFAGQQTDLYDVVVTQFSEKMHSELPNPTHFFGYTDLFTFDRKYLGGAIVATRGTPVLLTVTNLVPPKHILPVDPTIMAGPNGLMVGDLPTNRIATHLHGGLVPWYSDGTPFQWFTPLGKHGPSFKHVPGTLQIPGTGTYYYPNDQSARLVWYHDHAIGLTRLNAYAGIASAYIITDAFEQALVAPGGILAGLFPGIPLIIQDKTFLDKTKDPNYPVTGAKNGDLWYPWDYEKDTLPTGRWAYGPDQTPPAVIPNPTLPPIAEIPEFFADTAMVNGAPYPLLNVTGGTFRLRLLNGSQARFWHLNLYEEGSIPGEADTNKPGPAMYQIATEGGFLPNWVELPNGIPCPLTDPDTVNPDGPFNLLLAPAERADVLIDFTGIAPNTSFILYNDAPAPFPGGDPRNDYFTGDPDFSPTGLNQGGAPSTVAGFGPNTRTIMKIVVGSGSNGFLLTPTKLSDLSTALKQNFTGGNSVTPQQDPLLYHGADYATPGPVPFDGSLLPAGTVTRNLTLNEDFDNYGRLIQLEGTTTQNGLNNQGLPTWGRGYLDNPTESPNVGALEVWNIYNLTGDTHPIHFHLVNVQIIQRAQFGFDANTGMPIFTPIPSTERPPDANEIGWKETVRMNPGEVTTVIMKFDLPKVPFTVNPSTRDNINGNEYVWHCHILEHEEHDMMRPLVVVGPYPLAVVPESAAISGSKGGTATFAIVNGNPGYTITTSNPSFPPFPNHVNSSGGKFSVTVKRGTTPKIVTYTITDSAGAIVTGTLKIT